MLTNSRCEPIHLVLLVATVIMVVLSECCCPVQAGTCWMQFMDGGSCKSPQKRFVSRTECCGSGLNVGFTESDMSDQEWFMVLALGDGTSCNSCLDSCQTTKCGPNKRCVLRDGHPKCICAPVCKKSAQKTNHLPAEATHHRKRRRTFQSSDENYTARAHHRTDSGDSGSEPKSMRRKRRMATFGELHNSTWNPVSVVMKPVSFFNPVCGTDGRTYKTECQLKKRACRRDLTTLSVAYRGSCQATCKNVTCPTGMFCLQDQYLNPHCVNCSWKCPAAISRAGQHHPAAKNVCGVDGRTYRNLCEIRRAACRSGKAIPVAYRGMCKDPSSAAATTPLASCATVRCQNRQVCLEDLTTHRPRCVSCIAKCPRRRHQHHQHHPTHHQRSTHQPKLSSRSQVTSPDDPANASTTICGTNDLTYQSWCHMQKDSCSTGFYIDVQHTGACQPARNSTANASAHG